jgi:hypothetical protein
MLMTTRDQHLIQAHQTRSHAAEVLRELIDAKAQCEATLAGENRPDMFKAVSGQSSIETAIAEARRLVETLDRQIEEAARDLDTDDRDVLGCDGLEAVITAGRLALSGRPFGLSQRAVG